MVRWEPDSRGRLAKAAFALYGEQGYDRTTVAEIAERAGLTERTFFRQFADKREVLFAGATELQGLMVSRVLDAPASASALEAVTRALVATCDFFDGRREFSFKRRRIIEGSGELRERELIKMATLSAALSDALRQRGVAGPAADITGEVAIALFKVSFERWTTPGEERTLSQLMADSLGQLRNVIR